jgi:hypothetical protein
MYYGRPIPERRTAASDFCTAACEKALYYDEANFNGLRRSAVGYHERRCWVCGKAGLSRVNVHHVFGRSIPDLDIYVVLCQGCHMLVFQLCKRLFLTDPKRIADLIALARNEKLLPNARVRVTIEEM